MSQPNLEKITEQINQVMPVIESIKNEMEKVIVGQKELINSILIGLLSGGHLLLEGLPGLAKTLTVTTFAKIIALDFKRIQFTPDLLPADLIGTSIYNQKEAIFQVSKGPVFTNILLADEINRAPAKVQSALLEVMQEKQVTISGETFATGNPFLVLATQNPIEQEGTYPLPEAQTDRFMLKVKIEYPTREEEKIVMDRMSIVGPLPTVQQVVKADDLLSFRKIIESIYVDDKIEEYILNIVFATRFPKDYGVDIEGLLMFGASPRATIDFKKAAKVHAFLEGRAYVTPYDIKKLAHDILRHRLRLSYEAEAENINADQIIDKILETLIVP